MTCGYLFNALLLSLVKSCHAKYDTWNLLQKLTVEDKKTGKQVLGLRVE